MSRMGVAIGDRITAFFGKDHACGFFVQVYTNGTHDDHCLCHQCEFDQPAFEKDFCSSWHGIADDAGSFITDFLQDEAAGNEARSKILREITGV